MQLNLKRVLTLALAFVLLVGFFPVAAKAAETEETASVTVYFSMSHDEAFMEGENTGEAMALKKITVPYFDLGNYDLENFYFSSESYGDDGDGLPGSDLLPGTAEFARNKVTMLHLFIYATEVYYCGIEPEAAGQGYLKDAGILYTDVFNISGSVGSSFLNNLWGYDLNLNYYYNYEYPLASEGWGSTSDQVLLHDGDVVTLAHFTSWSFFSDPDCIFNYLTTGDREVETVVKQGETVTLNAMIAGPNVNGDCGTAQTPVTICPEIYIAPADEIPSGDVTEWDLLGTAEADGTFQLDTTNLAAGEYVVAMAGRYGSEITYDICSCPGGTRLIVEADTDSYYEDYPFSNVTADDSTQSLIDITDTTLPQEGFYNAQADVPAYQIIVPDGTETVHVTFNRTDFTTYTMSCDSATGEVGWDEPPVTLHDNGDGTMTVDIPAESFTDNTSYIVLEDNVYWGPLYGFNFVSGTPTVPGGGNKVAVTGVTLDKTTATVDLSDKETSFTLTATVAPKNASNKKVTWTSDNETVASVTSKGIVTAKGVGTATITATTKDGSFKATCKLTVTDVNAPETDSEGTYLISTAKQLKWFADHVNSGSYTLNAKLTADIDLSTVCSATLGSWTPIGCFEMNDSYYAGSFDGQHHTISNLYMKEWGNAVDTSTYYRSLFGLCTKGCTIQNVNLTGTINTDHRYIGGLVGSVGNWNGKATVENCHVDVDITASSPYYVGGVAGQLRNGSTVKNCSFSGTITSSGTSTTGGIVGTSATGTNEIIGCLFDGSIVDTGAAGNQKGVGGIIGYTGCTVTITDCANVGTMETSSMATGGIVGTNYKLLTVNNCYNAASLSAGENSVVGGIVASNVSNGTVTEEYCFYLNTFASSDISTGVAKTADELKSAATVRALGSSFKLSDGTVNKGFPGLSWQDYDAPELPALPTGDINGDGEVDNVDANTIYGYFNATIELDAESLAAADINGDGEVDNMDALMIYNYFNGTVDSLGNDSEN